MKFFVFKLEFLFSLCYDNHLLLQKVKFDLESFDFLLFVFEFGSHLFFLFFLFFLVVFLFWLEIHTSFKT